MVYAVMTMRFKREYQTHEATAKLGVDDRTLWRWADKGWVRMRREGQKGPRFFDADQIDKLVPEVPKNRPKGVSFFPDKKRR